MDYGKFYLFTSDKLHINSGDEYSYEYVRHEKSYFVNTWNQRGILVLPSSPMPGMKIIVSDYYGSWAANSLTIHRNGNKIMGLEENMECDEPFAIFAMTFIPSTGLDWVVHQNIKTVATDAIDKKIKESLT